MPEAADLFFFFHAGDEARPSLVLLHGAGGTHLYWPPEIRRLPGYPVYALDLPGAGHMLMLEQPKEAAELLKAFLDRL